MKWDMKRNYITLHYAVTFQLTTVFLNKLLQQQQRGVGRAGIALSLPGLVVDTS